MSEGVPAGGMYGPDMDESRALQQYRALVDTIDDGLYQLDPDGRIVAVNEVIPEVTGYPREDLIGEHVSLLLDQEDIERIASSIYERLKGEQKDDPTFELTIETAGGEAVPCELRTNLILNEGEFEGTVGVVRDIRERKRREETISRTRESYKAITSVLDEANVGVFVLSEELEVAWINVATEEYFGIDRADVLGRDKRQVVQDIVRDRIEDPETFTTKVLDAYEANSYIERFECRVTAGPHRQERWLEHYSKPIERGRYAGGRIELYYDITDRKASEQARRESEHRVRSLVNAVDEYALFMLDPDGHVMTWNKGAKKIKGYERDEILGDHFSAFYTEEDIAAGEPDEILSAAASRGTIVREGRRVRKDGSTFWANVTVTAIRNEDGDLQGFAKITRDMTDRRKHERLRHREQILEEYREYTDNVLDTIEDVFYIIDDDRTVRRWNESFADETGYAKGEIEAMRTTEFFVERDRERLDAAFDRCFEKGTAQLEANILTKTGEQLPYEFAVSSLEDPNGDAVIAGIGRDITERNRRLAELEQRAEQQQVVADLGQYALEVDDLDTLLQEASTRVASALETEYCQILDLDSAHDELLLRRGVGWDDGIVGEATVSAVETNSQAAYTLATDQPVVVEDLDTESRFSGPHLLTSHDVKSGISTIIGPYDDPWGVLGAQDTAQRAFTEQDVNFIQSVANVLAEAIERRQYQDDLQELIDELEQSNARLEQFAYAASHDLQEPLRMVSSYLQLLEDRYAEDLDQEAEEFLTFAVDGADRMRNMIDGLLQYSRVDTQGNPFEWVDLNTVLEDVMEDLHFHIQESEADIRAESLPEVWGDPGQLRQVFQNLIMNAIEYSGDDPPTIHIAAEAGEDHWNIAVSDEGIGIDPDEHDRIFTVFQRLHTADEHPGTGIGLALCQRIVERHGGDIDVASAPGEGSTFTVTLPRGRHAHA